MTIPQYYYFLGKNNSPQWIPTPCFETKLHEQLKSTFKEKHDCETKTSKMYTERNILSLLLENPPPSKKKKIHRKIINKGDWTNLTIKNLNMYIQQ